MSDPIMQIVPTLESLANEVKLLREQRGELMAVLSAVSVQLECPSRNTTMTSYRRDGSVIISSDVREMVKQAIEKAKAQP